VFTTPEGLFEPTMIFFESTNSLAIFQTMMKKILRNLINTGKVVRFIDNFIVGTEKEEVHDKIIEKIVKRLAENDLYIKPEKYKWKVKKVEFLEVVIGPERIKIEEENMKGVLKWLTLKEIKDI